MTEFGGAALRFIRGLPLSTLGTRGGNTPHIAAKAETMGYARVLRRVCDSPP